MPSWGISGNSPLVARRNPYGSVDRFDFGQKQIVLSLALPWIGKFKRSLSAKYTWEWIITTQSATAFPYQQPLHC